MSNANFVCLLGENNSRLIIINTIGYKNINTDSVYEVIETILSMNMTQSLPISNNIKNIIKCFLIKKRVSCKKSNKNKRTMINNYLYILKYYFKIFQSKFSNNKYLIHNLIIFCKSILFNIINRFSEIIKSIIHKLKYFYSSFNKNNTGKIIILYDANFYPLIEQQEHFLNVVEHPIIKELENFCIQKYKKNEANKIEYKNYFSEKESYKRIGLKKISEL